MGRHPLTQCARSACRRRPQLGSGQSTGSGRATHPGGPLPSATAAQLQHRCTSPTQSLHGRQRGAPCFDGTAQWTAGRLRDTSGGSKGKQRVASACVPKTSPPTSGRAALSCREEQGCIAAWAWRDWRRRAGDAPGRRRRWQAPCRRRRGAPAGGRGQWLPRRRRWVVARHAGDAGGLRIGWRPGHKQRRAAKMLRHQLGKGAVRDGCCPGCHICLCRHQASHAGHVTTTPCSRRRPASAGASWQKEEMPPWPTPHTWAMEASSADGNRR